MKSKTHKEAVVPLKSEISVNNNKHTFLDLYDELQEYCRTKKERGEKIVTEDIQNIFINKQALLQFPDEIKIQGQPIVEDIIFHDETREMEFTLSVIPKSNLILLN